MPSAICFNGGVVDGVIQESPRVLVYMTADVGSAAPDTKIKPLRMIFNSARG